LDLQQLPSVVPLQGPNLSDIPLDDVLLHQYLRVVLFPDLQGLRAFSLSSPGDGHFTSRFAHPGMDTALKAMPAFGQPPGSRYRCLKDPRSGHVQVLKAIERIHSPWAVLR